MEAKLEAILREIYTLEPQLLARDPEVRVMVRELLEVRPQVAPDRAFVARLRDEVMGVSAAPAAAVKARAPQRDFMWWSYHLAPVGVFAALTLALIGGPNSIYRDFMQDPFMPPPDVIRESMEESTETAPAPTNMDVDAPSDAMLEQTGPADARMLDMGGDAMMMSKEAVPQSDGIEYGTMDYGAAKMQATAGDRIEVSDQAPGGVIMIDTLALSAQGHVRLFIYDGVAPGAVIATTPLIPSGTHHRVPVTLMRPVRPGETIFAQAFVSDGDAVFEEYEDIPLYDADGGFVYTIFMISN